MDMLLANLLSYYPIQDPRHLMRVFFVCKKRPLRKAEAFLASKNRKIRESKIR